VKVDFLYIFKFSNDKIEKAIQRLICSIRSIKNQNYGGVVNIYVVNSSEADISPDLKDLCLNYIFKPVTGYFNKSFLINCAVNNFIKSEYFFISDIDLIYGPDYIKNSLQMAVGQATPVRIIPYHCCMIREKYNLNYVEASREPMLNTFSSIAPGNGLIHLDSFKKIKGYDEYYLGYGQEDADLNLRMKSVANVIETNSIISYHIWHNPINREYINQNSIYYHNKKNIWNREGYNINNSTVNLNNMNWGLYPNQIEWINSPKMILRSDFNIIDNNMVFKEVLGKMD